MTTIVEKIQARLNEIGEAIHGAELPSIVLDYLNMCEATQKFTGSLMERAGDRHLGFVPFINQMAALDIGMDPRLWALVYRGLEDKFDYPIEAYMCIGMSLSQEVGSFAIKFNEIIDVITPDGRLEEYAYAFALAGIEEDWWDFDDLDELPSRREDVVHAMQVHAQMTEGVGQFESLFGSSETGPAEGWLVNEPKPEGDI